MTVFYKGMVVLRINLAVGKMKSDHSLYLKYDNVIAPRELPVLFKLIQHYFIEETEERRYGWRGNSSVVAGLVVRFGYKYYRYIEYAIKEHQQKRQRRY